MFMEADFKDGQKTETELLNGFLVGLSVVFLFLKGMKHQH
jgi:hypothetical protein